ncbi:hypothetical protein K474DRAFT_1668788 [Panus rudis PR-1116 ss-1]|nr:hypothetical protein K474DRAFT_1668788 [Panus rudis PR-1116 ss-1]
MGMLARFIRDLVPPPEDRQALDWSTLPATAGFFLPLQILACLSQRRGTKALRIFLLPFILTAIVRGTFHYGSPYSPEDFLFSWSRGLVGFNCIALALDFTFLKRTKLASSQTQHIPAAEPANAKPNDSSCTAGSKVSLRHVNTDEDVSLPERKAPKKYGHLLTWYKDSVEVMLCTRGIGYDYGADIYIPPDTRDLRRGPFLRSAAYTCFTSVLTIDIIQTFLISLPRIGSYYGGTIFLPELSPVPRYALSTLIHILVGKIIICALEGWYSLATFIAVGFLEHSPASWPPLFDQPWKADSLHDFWNKRWHQLLRRTFIVLGGIPGRAVAGRAGLVFGTFLASGLYHEYSMYLVNRGFDHRTTMFFVMQAAGILAEEAFRRFTGRRVSGWPGRIWTMISIIGLGQLSTDAWLSRGLAGAHFLSESISPVRRLLLPTVHYLFGKYY